MTTDRSTKKPDPATLISQCMAGFLIMIIAWWYKRIVSNFAGDTMKIARILVVVIGILLPYLSRIPGALLYGSTWLTDYLAGGAALLFFAAFNAIAWGCILLSTITYRSPHAVWFPTVCGFGFLALVHGTYDLRSDAQAAIGLVFIPLYSLPFVLIGWLLGLAYDRLRPRPIHNASAKL